MGNVHGVLARHIARAERGGCPDCALLDHGSGKLSGAMLALPWWLPLLLLLTALPGALGLALAAGRARKLKRMHAIEEETLPSDVCLACDSSHVALVAPEVVRCLSCGFVGGQGMADWQAQRQAEQTAQLPPAERQTRAREKLLQARMQISSAQQLLESALTLSRVDIAGLSFDHGHEKQSRWAEAIGALQSAQNLASEAAQLLDAALLDQDLTQGLSPLLLSLDTSWLSDGLITDVAVHARIKDSRAQAEQVALAVERLQSRIDALGGLS